MTSLDFWTYAFVIVAYGMAAACLYRGFRNGYRDSGVPGIVRELLVFGGMVAMLYLVESWALLRTPYYTYATTFPDPLSPQSFSWLPKFHDPVDACSTLVKGLPDIERKLPLSVVLFEGALVYAGMWTARRITHNLALQPLFVGFAALLVDLVLDPVVAASVDCKGIVKPLGGGVGLWSWYLPTNAQLDKTTGEQLVAAIFDVPAFNFAAWLGAPIIVVALLNVIPYFREAMRAPAQRRSRERKRRIPVFDRCVDAFAEQLPPKRVQPQTLWGWGLVVALIPTLVVLASAPTVSRNLPCVQYAALAIGFVVVLGVLVKFLRTEEDRKDVDTVLMVPVVLAFGTGIAAGLLANRFVMLPVLMPLGIMALFVALFLHWLPYKDALETVRGRIDALDRFVRLHYFGFTAMLLLLGAALCDRHPTTWEIGGLLAIALAFHVYSYVSNDVIDLEVDRRQGLRESDPLVRGYIQPYQALALALVSIPVAGLVLFLLIGQYPSRAQLGFGAFGAAVVLMGAYNYWGKKLKVPLLTDWAQGLAWGALAVVGAAVGAVDDPDRLLRELWWGPGLLLAYGTLYIALISGVHGGLRDLINDKACEARTTAQLLGATPDPVAVGSVRSSTLLVVYAHVLHALLFCAFAAYIALNRDRGLPDDTHLFEGWRLLAVAISLAVIFVAATVMLQRVVQRQAPAGGRGYWLARHALLLLLPPLLVFAIANGPAPAFKIGVFTATLVPLLFADFVLGPLSRRLFGPVSAARPPGSAPPGSTPNVSGQDAA